MNSEIITVAVLSYNSSKTIIETLDSIYNQSYQNIILIINDDGSQDQTKEIITSWVQKNRKRFIDVKLFFHSTNSGINKSFDFIINQSNSKWVKFIAADDILLKDCIIDNLYFVKENNINTILYSKIIPFKVENCKKIIMKDDTFELRYAVRLSKLSAKKQYKQLLKNDILYSPTGFINSELYKEKIKVDTEIRNIEDWPLRLQLTLKGYKIYFMQKETVMYRIGNSVSHTSKYFYNVNHIKQIRILKRKLVYPNLSYLHIFYYLNELLENIRYKIIIDYFRNKKNILTIGVCYITMIFDTTKWKKFLLKLLRN